MESRKNARHKLEVTPYDFSNEFLNKVHEGETIWICQGSAGRKPVIADTREEAIEYYLTKWYEDEVEEESFE